MLRMSYLFASGGSARELYDIDHRFGALDGIHIVNASDGLYSMVETPLIYLSQVVRIFHPTSLIV
jgi:hypothetical protein